MHSSESQREEVDNTSPTGAPVSFLSRTRVELVIIILKDLFCILKIKHKTHNDNKTTYNNTFLSVNIRQLFAPVFISIT